MSSPSSNLRRCLIGLVVLAVGVAMWWGTVESSREKLDRAGRLLSEKRFVEAAELAESVSATSDEAWVLAGKAYTHAGDYDRALEVYGRVPARGGRAAVSARGGRRGGGDRGCRDRLAVASLNRFALRPLLAAATLG